MSLSRLEQHKTLRASIIQGLGRLFTVERARCTCTPDGLTA